MDSRCHSTYIKKYKGLKMLALCDNEKCEAYKDKSCKRAVMWQNMLDSGWKKSKNMITPRDNEKMCEAFVPVDL